MHYLVQEKRLAFVTGTRISINLGCWSNSTASLGYSMVSLSLEQIILLLDHKEESIVGSNMILLRNKYGLEKLVPFYVKAFYKLKKSPARRDIAFWLVRFSKKHTEVVDMALHGINDRSKLVRSHCCSILAYAGSRDYLLKLDELLSHSSTQTQEDAQAAINCIVNENHHLWADRNNKGNVFWHVGK